MTLVVGGKPLVFSVEFSTNVSYNKANPAGNMSPLERLLSISLEPVGSPLSRKFGVAVCLEC